MESTPGCTEYTVEHIDIVDTRDREVALRDALLCALQDAKRPMTPKELSVAAKLSRCMVSTVAGKWPRYFAVDYRPRDRSVLLINLHKHLRTA